jgi:Putative binding domain, N-terminal/Viral BACON domain
VPPAIDSDGFQSAEYLPAVERALNLTCTVRDGRGGVNGDAVVLNVAGNAGPFLVTQPNTSVTLTGGMSQTVSWSVNNTNIAPVNCSSVRILLSTDGGNTFPNTLAANTPNDGAEVVTLPSTLITTAARIKVEAVGNIFFDISDSDFTILPGGTCPVVSGAGGLGVQIGTIGTSVSISGANFSGVNAVRFANGASGVNAAFTVVSGNLITTTVPAGAVTGPITISKPGCSDAQTGTFTVAPCAASSLSIDDGSFELFWSISGPTSYWVNRITPASYPATLTAVSIYNGDIPAGSNMTVVAGANTDGDSDINNTVFQSRAVTAMAQGQFATYSVPSITINSGDFVVGFRFVPVSGVFPGAQDTTPPARNRSFVSIDGTSFFTISDQNPGNWGIRGEVYLRGSISPTAHSFGGAGGAGTVSVTSPSGCTWSAVSTVSWIHITSGASGTGNGTVGYSVETNTGAARNGVLAIAGQTFTVNQSANDGCEYSLNLASNSYGSGGGSGSVNVTAPAGCGWNAETSASWVTVTSGSGTGNGVMNFTVASNIGFARTATISVGGQQFVVKQSAKFADVDPTAIFAPFIEKLSALEITVGCGQDFAGRPLYCPGAAVTRDQMSAFIIRALGMSNPPPPALQRFQDVAPSNPFFPFVDQMAVRGITVGCHPPGNPVALFCPGATVTRDQMAAFIIRAVGLTNPPVPASQRFLDVSPTNVFYAFIDQMAIRSITTGCDPAGTMYCPSSNVTRDQMAAFLVRAFGL